MTELFDVVGENFFSLLASKNKHIYFRGLMVLRQCYQSELRLRRSVLVSYLVEHLMNDLINLGVNDDDVTSDRKAANHGAVSSDRKAANHGAVSSDGNPVNHGTGAGNTNPANQGAVSGVGDGAHDDGVASGGNLANHGAVSAEDISDMSVAAGSPTTPANARTTAAGSLTTPANARTTAQTPPASVPDETTLSGFAHVLIRRFQETGWLDAVPDEHTTGEILLVPEHASAILDVLYNITHPSERPYNSYVYSTYSVLRTANEDKDYLYPALQGAYDNTQLLLDSLRALLHNIHQFYRSLQHHKDIRKLLEEHFDSYQVMVAMKTYHPLKTVDSVHRFRPRILSILRQWLVDGEMMDNLVNSMATHRSDFPQSEARYEIIRMIQFVMDSFESMDGFLSEIDRRNSSYSRASVERIQYLLNTDRDVKGKLVEILKRAPSLEDDAENALVKQMSDLPMYHVQLVDEDSLYTEPKRRSRGTPSPLRLEDKARDHEFQQEAAQLVERVNSLYSRDRIVDFILSQMADDGRLQAGDMQLRQLEDYLRTMVAVVLSDERGVPYEIMYDPDDGVIQLGSYRVPAMAFVKRDA